MGKGAPGAGAAPHASGVIASLRGLAATAVAVAHTRLQLLANDLEEQRVRGLQMIVLGAIALFCGAVGVLLISAWIIVAFWDQHRLLTLAVLAVVYFAGCAIALLRLKARMQTHPPLFGASLAELRRDEELLRP